MSQTPLTPGQRANRTGGSGVRKAQAAETEARLKDAARRVFARRGYLNTKIRDITDEAGRAAGSFYNHFPSKEALLEALLGDFVAEFDERIDHLGADHDLSDRATLREHVAAGWYAYKGHRAEFLALRQASMVGERFALRWRQRYVLEVRPMSEHMERLREAGYNLPGDPAVVASAVIAMLEQFCYVWLIENVAPGDRQLEDDEAIETLTSLILHGILGPAPHTAVKG